jgi:hypothetical protein
MESGVRRRSTGLAAALLVATTTRLAFAGLTIDIGAGSAQRSQQASVPITMSQASGPVRGVQVDVLFPKAALTAANPDGACTLASGVPGSVSTRLVSVPGTPADMGRLRVIVTDVNGANLANGTLVTCRFHVTATAPVGTQQALSGAELVVSNPSGSVVGATLDQGSIKVCPDAGCC